MKKRVLATLVTVGCLLGSWGAVAGDKPGVAIYATGGTIAGSAASNRDTTNYKAGSLGVDVLINAVPELKDVATVSGEQISNVASGDISQAILLKMAKSINARLASPDIHGVVVTSESKWPVSSATPYRLIR